MATFNPAYEIVRRNEGYYSFNPDDVGGETYAGVARNYYPNWDGWVIVDYYKALRGGLKTNEQVTGIEGKVKEFYRDRWQESRAGEINNQAIANIYFDFYILHSKAARAIQEVLNELGQPVVIDNVLGTQTLAAINSFSDPALLHDAYKAKRIAYHLNQVKNYPSQAVFLAGWIKRSELFANLAGRTGRALFAVAILAVFLWLATKKFNNKKIEA